MSRYIQSMYLALGMSVDRGDHDAGLSPCLPNIGQEAVLLLVTDNSALSDSDTEVDYH